MRRASIASVLLAFSSACVSPDPPSDTSEASDTGTSETGADEPGLATALEAEGFVVQAGHVSSFLVEDCAELNECFGNNASSPYLLFSVPPHPDRPGELPSSAVGDIPKVPAGMTPAAHLDAREALVIVGQTPPAAKYFGLTPYLFQRTPAGGGERVNVFASLGDSLNPVNASTGPGGPFDAPFAVIASADAQTMAGARAALEAAGVASEAINEMVVPAELVDFGLELDVDDTLMLLGRLALFDDPAAGAAYVDAVPLELYRVTPSADDPADPLPTPARTPRGDGTSEDALLPALDALEAAIEATLVGTDHELIPIASAAVISSVIAPGVCLQNTTECLGDNGDTTYAAGPLTVVQADGVLTLGPDDAFIAFGVNHAAAGKATYSNLNVYAQAKRVGVAAVDDARLQGTAATYLPDHPDADKLWAYEIRRDCADRPNCLTLPTGFPGIGLDENLFFIFRAYLQPGSSVSAAPDELLAERVFLVRGV